MKNRLAAWGILGLATTLAMVACSGDDDTGSPQTAGTGGGGTTSGGTKSGGTSSGGTTSAGTTSGGTASGGTSTAGSSGAGTSGGGSGGTLNGAGAGGEAGAAGAPIEGGEGGVGGAAEGGAAGASGAGGDGGAGGSGDEDVTLTPTTCNYTEVESNSSQSSGLDAKTALKVICGKLDTGHFNANLLDSDSYGITLTGGQPALFRLELPTFTGLTRVEVTIDQNTVVITQPVSVFTLPNLFSSAVVRVNAYSAADLSESIPYQLSVVSDNVSARCAANTNAATFTEAGDGANSRGNDVYTFDNDVPSTTSANDSAEATGITLTQPSYRVNGVSADVTRVGDFLDGDSYGFRTGPSTTQLTLRADWQGSHNMDLFVVKAGTVERAGLSTTFSNTSPEYVTVRVKPNTDYVAFAGGFSGSPFDYALTLCGETYSFNGP